MTLPLEQAAKWVQVSTELLAELGEWSEPVQAKVVSDTDGVLDLIFRRYEVKDDIAT